MLRKNEEREGVVECLGMNGEGIVKENGATVFVPFALTGEKISYKILKEKNYINDIIDRTPTEDMEKIREKINTYINEKARLIDNFSFDK